MRSVRQLLVVVLVAGPFNFLIGLTKTPAASPVPPRAIVKAFDHISNRFPHFPERICSVAVHSPEPLSALEKDFSLAVHPLEPLSAAEIVASVQLLKKLPQFNTATRIISIILK